MGFERRYGNDHDSRDELIESLAALYCLEVAEARELLGRAQRESAYDEYRRPVREWFDWLVREPHLPDPGKRALTDGWAPRTTRLPDPGKRARTDSRALRTTSSWIEPVDVAPGRRTRVATEMRRLEERRAFLARRGAPASLDSPRGVAATMARMEDAYGSRFDDVEIHADSAQVPAGAQAFTQGKHVHVEPGLDLDSEHGERVLAHELAHVVQQSRTSTWDVGLPPRAALEADAQQAAQSALAGHAATVRLAAPASMALGYSEGDEPAQRKARGGQSGGGQSGGASDPGPRSDTRAAPRAKANAPAAPEPTSTAPRQARGGDAPPAAASGDARRTRGTDGVLLPEAPTAIAPGTQQRLDQIGARNQTAGTMVATLPSAEQSTDKARGAVEEPTVEQDARAQHGVVAAVDDRPPPSPEIEAACTRIREVIKNKRPPDEDKLVEAKPREMAAEAGAQMDAGVESRTDGVRQEYEDVQQTPKGQPSREPVPVQLPPSKVETPAIDAGAGAPEPSAPEETSLDDDVAAQEQKLDDAGMNTEPAKLVQDGPIGDARGGVGELKGMAKTDPQKVRLEQGKAIAKAQADMHNLQAAADKALADARSGTVTNVGAQSKEIKGSEEQQRARAGQEMQAIFQRTQKTVDGLLTPLARTALAKWQAGVDRLSTEFEGRLASVKTRIEERYKSEDNGNPLDELGAMWNKGTDAVFGLPDWVVIAYDAAEGAFATGCMDLLRDISRDVNDVIETCRKLIQQARQDIDKVVQSLPKELQSWAQGEAARLGKELDNLDKKVTDTQKNINQDLVKRAYGAVQDVRQRVHELREAAKGLIGKIADAVAAFLENPFKAIVDGLLRILGIPPGSFWALVGRLGDVISAIAKEPIRFANTLIEGSGQGFTRFFDRFPQHLGQGLLSWLFGTLGADGVQMPSDFSGPSVMGMVLGLVGIDAGLVSSMLGEGLEADELAEARQEASGALSGGPLGLVELLREHFDPASIIPLIKEAAIEFLMMAIIRQAAIRIIALFNPAGAILQAVELIFKTLIWVVQNAARIFTLIETLVGAAGMMAAGNVGGVAAAVESSLVQIIPLVIDFLAIMIGVGGLPGKIREILMKLGGKLKGSLQKVIAAIMGRAKAKARAKRDAKKKPDGDGDSADGKDDERDPRKAKDSPDENDPRRRKDTDENDPRRAKDGPDENDPRRANRKDDDRDPNKRKDGDEDDRDPNKRKDDDDDGDDLAAARRAARAAADRGWAAARSASSREVLSKAELQQTLSRAEDSTPKVKISLEAQDKGSSWSVDADAKVGAARASDTEGNGWIARGDGNQPWYAARDLTGFNRKLIQDGFETLKEGTSSAEADGPAPDERAQYDHKVQQGQRVVADMQRRLDGEIRGLEADIDMEPWSGAERDHRIRTKLSVKPNTTEVEQDIPLAAGGDDEIGKHLHFTAGGESHTLWVDTTGARPIVMMASTPRSMDDHLTSLRARRDELADGNPELVGETVPLFGSVESRNQVVEQRATEAKMHRVDSPERARLDKEVEAAEDALCGPLTELLNLLGVEIPDALKPRVEVKFKYHGGLRAPASDAARYAGFTFEDYDQQVAGQETGLNAMNVGEWQRNRERYIERSDEGESGRDPIAGTYQETFRRTQLTLLRDILEAPEGTADVTLLVPASARFVTAAFERHPEHRDGGLPKALAQTTVAEWLDTQAALHDPDQVAGGYPEGLTDLGNNRINKSLGSQWGKTCAAQLDNGVNDRLHDVPRALWKGVKMRVTLTVTRRT